MGAVFDPYHKWLGIPPEEQPPNHYRLLGIKDFEADPDVIEAAADQRMGHLRRYQTTQHSDLSQRLLNEVAAARICLLKPSKRAAYDEQLRLAMPAATAPTGAQSADVAFPVVEEEWSPRIAHPKAMRWGRRAVAQRGANHRCGIGGGPAAAGLCDLAARLAHRLASARPSGRQADRIVGCVKRCVKRTDHGRQLLG